MEEALSSSHISAFSVSFSAVFCRSGIFGWLFRFITQNPTCLGYSCHREEAAGAWCSFTFEAI